MTFKTLKDIILIVLLIILGVLIGQGNKLSKEHKAKERQFKQEQIKWSKIILAERSARSEEVKIRKEIRKKDSIELLILKVLKKTDSTRQIKTIRNLRSQFAKYTEPELDSMLIIEYEKSLLNN